MANFTLYDVVGDILLLQDMLESGEYDEETINDTLESVMYDFEHKADGYGKVIRNMEAGIDALDSAINELTEKKKRLKNGIEKIKNRLSDAMKITGTDEIDGELFKFKFRNNAKQLPKDLKIDQVPKEYLIEQEPKIDKKGLLAAVKAEKVKGIELVQSRTLQMR